MRYLTMFVVWWRKLLSPSLLNSISFNILDNAFYLLDYYPYLPIELFCVDIYAVSSFLVFGD